MATVTIPPHLGDQRQLVPPMSVRCVNAIQMAVDAWSALEPRLPDGLAMSADAIDIENALKTLARAVREAQQ